VEAFFQDTEEEEESVITYPHLRILPVTFADNPCNIYPQLKQFTRLNIRSSAHPHLTGGRYFDLSCGLFSSMILHCDDGIRHVEAVLEEPTNQPMWNSLPVALVLS